MIKAPNQSPIGIFDSGIGGLTVARSVLKALPHENIIYFGDTARVPYGIKSGDTIRRYSAEIARFLMARNVKTILIACNTVSAVAGNEVQKVAGNIPVLDVISAGTQAALAANPKKIGVIGTLATIGSGAYEKSLRGNNNQVDVVTKACPMLVPLAEEGWTDNEIAFKTLETYLNEFRNNGVDSLILGCTHYPLFKKSIQSLFNSKNVRIIDSADAIADMTLQLLEEKQLIHTQDRKGSFDCFVTDRPQRFQDLAERFLGRQIPEVQILNLP